MLMTLMLFIPFQKRLLMALMTPDDSATGDHDK